MQIKTFILILFLITPFIGSAQMQVTSIQGKAIAYAGQEITLYSPADPFNLLPQKIANFTVKGDGSFFVEFLLNQTSYIYSEFDNWHAYCYLNPGESYQMEFPPFKAITDQNKLNPYFKYEVIPFGLHHLPVDDINRKIQHFNVAYSKIESKYFSAIYGDKSHEASAKMRAEILQQFTAPSYTYFGKYVYYRIGLIEYSLIQSNRDLFINNYMNIDRLAFNVPPFLELFDKLFTNYFYTEIFQHNNKTFAKTLRSGRLSEVEKFFARNKQWGEPLSRMVILKGINDAYYQQHFPSKLLLNILSQVQDSDWTSSEKEIANALYAKMTYLITGTKVPNMQLMSLSGESKELDDFIKDKYTYIHFSNPSNPICRHHLDKLSELALLHSNNYNFIVIIPLTNKKHEKLLKEQEWNLNICYAEDEELDKFKIISYPYSYIANAKGLFESSPANNPLDNLEKELNSILLRNKVPY